MTVILGSNKKISDSTSTFIGETTFLQEFYKDSKIISWTHYGAHDYDFFRNGLNTSLEPIYVDSVLAKFKFSTTDVQAITLEKNYCPVLLHECGRSGMVNEGKKVEEELKEISLTRIIRLKRKGSTIFQFVSCQSSDGVKLLPIVSNAKTTLSINGYNIIDVPADGNCAFTSVKVAMNDNEFKDKIEEKLTFNKLDAETLRNDTADKMGKVITCQNDFIKKLRKPGFWNSGIDGDVGIEVLSFVAEVIKQPILVITQEPKNQYHYWISGTIENPRDGNLTFHDVEEKDLENLLDDNQNAIKLFHNGIHFQVIIKKEISLLFPLISNFTVKIDDNVRQEQHFSATDTLPSSSETQETIPTELAKAGYKIQNVPGDGNCGVWAVLVASGRITLEELQALMKAYNEAQTQYGIGINWKNCGKILQRKAPTATKKMEEFRTTYTLEKPGDWVGEEHVPQISEALGKPIVVVYTIDGLPIYTLYSSTEIIDLKGSIGQIKLEHSNAIFIYYAHNHYQAIVKQ